MGHINELSEFEKGNPIEDLDIVEANNCYEFTKLVNVLNKCHVELKQMSCGAQTNSGRRICGKVSRYRNNLRKNRNFSKTIKARGRAIKRHLNEEAEQRALDRENRNREFELNVRRQELEHSGS